jgi:hypothetical protein
MRPTFQILVVFVAVVGLTTGGAFAGGVLYGRESAPESEAPQTTTAATGTGGGTRIVGPGGAGQAGGAAPTTGVVEKVEGQTMTVKTQDGASVAVTLQPDTQVTQVAPAATTDLQPGVPVSVSGQPGSDGTIAARSVQIGGRGGPAGAGGARPSPAASPSP